MKIEQLIIEICKSMAAFDPEVDADGPARSFADALDYVMPELAQRTAQIAALRAATGALQLLGSTAKNLIRLSELRSDVDPHIPDIAEIGVVRGKIGEIKTNFVHARQLHPVFSEIGIKDLYVAKWTGKWNVHKLADGHGPIRGNYRFNGDWVLTKYHIPYILPCGAVIFSGWWTKPTTYWMCRPDGTNVTEVLLPDDPEHYNVVLNDYGQWRQIHSHTLSRYCGDTRRIQYLNRDSDWPEFKAALENGTKLI